MKVAIIGEVMAELSPVPGESGSLMKLGFGGDTFNTAIYLSRMGGQADYITRLGDDPYSQQILDMLRCENVGIDHIEQVAGRCVGLYAIENDDDGERRFFYWREQSPATELFDNCASPSGLFAALKNYEYLYLTGITLAIISDRARQELFRFIGEYRQQGGKFIFDSNYRPRLWASLEQAQSVTEQALALSDIALLTYEDEALLWSDATVTQRLDVYQQLKYCGSGAEAGCRTGGAAGQWAIGLYQCAKSG